MEGLSSLVKPILESDVKNETLSNILQACVDQRSFVKDSSEIPSIIGVINAHCNASSTRLDGLLLLQSFLPQCTQDLLSKNATLWMQFCLKSMRADETAHVAFTVFKMLVQLSERVPDMSKYITSVGIPSIGEQIQQGVPTQAYLSALECLEQCMSHYSGSCGPQKRVLEQFLYPMLDYCGPQFLKIMWQTGRCIALLPQIGGGGKGGVVHRQGWSSHHKGICRSIHLIVDELYGGLNEIQFGFAAASLEGAANLPLVPIVMDDSVLQIQKLTHRLTALNVALQCTLVKVYPVIKDISLSSIIGLICRGLAVNGSSMGDSLTTNRLALASNLPKIHYSLLKTLEALIRSTQTNMLPFSKLICKLVIQTLKWTQQSDWPYGSEKPYRYLRTQAYEVLKVWCGVAKSGCCAEDIAQQFVDLSLHDVYAEKETVSLAVAINKKQGSQKAKRKSLSTTNSGASHSTLLLNKVANKQMCSAALQALTSLVMAVSCKMQASLHQILQETVVSALLQVINTTEDTPIPYSEAAPRLELYRLMLQLVLDGHSVWPAPTNIALKIFSNGLNDQDTQISILCAFALSSLEKIIHPAYSSMTLIADIQELELCRDEENDKQVAPLPAYKRNASMKQSAIELEPSDIVPVMEKKNYLGTLSSSNVGMNSVVETPRLFSRSLINAPVGSSANSSESTSQFIAASTPKLVPSISVVEASPSKIVADADTNEEVSESHQEYDESETKAQTKTIDLTGSDNDVDDEISEIPCEVDLAEDSDDIRSNVSICSQATECIPDTENIKPNVSSDKLSPGQQKSTTENEVSEATEEGGEVNEGEEVPVATHSETGKRAAEEDGEEISSPKKQKPSAEVEDYSYDDLDTETMLTSFVNVTREDEEEDLSIDEGNE